MGGLASAGYSGKPLAAKPGLKDRMHAAFHAVTRRHGEIDAHLVDLQSAIKRKKSLVGSSKR